MATKTIKLSMDSVSRQMPPCESWYDLSLFVWHSKVSFLHIALELCRRKGFQRSHSMSCLSRLRSDVCEWREQDESGQHSQAISRVHLLLFTTHETRPCQWTIVGVSAVVIKEKADCPPNLVFDCLYRGWVAFSKSTQRHSESGEPLTLKELFTVKLLQFISHHEVL